MTNWKVFQTDVLDVMKQYEGYFDFFERIGSMNDDSRPDCVARISREDKKEIWVVDAKNKPDLDQDDQQRMNHYIEVVKSNPSEIGLDRSELSSHTVRGIFVTSSGSFEAEDFEQLKFSALHQFLQRELVYTDTDRVVRDVAKMVERKQLSQSQARLLFKSIKPFEKSIDRALEVLDEIETRYIGLELEKPPINSFDQDLPVDAVLTHEPRGKVFLFDIPYSPREVERTEDKVKEISETLEDTDKEVFYAVINRFESRDQEYMYQLNQLEDEIRQAAGIVSPDEIAELFTPKVPVEKEYSDEAVVVRDTSGIGFKLEVRSRDDINHNVNVLLPQEAVKEYRDTALNSRRDMGHLQNNRFIQNITVSEDMSVNYNDTSESWSSYCDSIKAVYQSAVNPALSKKHSKVN